MTTRFGAREIVMNVPTQCPDCGGRMEEGFIPDATYGGILQTHWYPGEPEETSFLGIATGMKVEKTGMLPIEAHRCSRCGVLRLYA